MRLKNIFPPQRNFLFAIEIGAKSVALTFFRLMRLNGSAFITDTRRQR